MRRTAWFLRHCPITVLVAAPYAILVLPSAIFFGNPATGFILALLAVATLTVVTTELLLVVLRSASRGKERDSRSSPASTRALRAARLVAVTSVVADVGAAFLGRGTLLAQVSGEATSSPVAAVAGTIAGWRYLALGLLLYVVRSGIARTATFYRWAAVLLAAQLTVALITTITQPFIAYLTCVVAAGAITRVIPVRHVVVAIMIVFLTWPALFALRNDVRETRGVLNAASMTAGDRLRVDRQISRVHDFNVPVDLGQPGVAEAVRYGLIPRIFDEDRPSISTGLLINRFMGGTATSADSFLALGNIYFFYGNGGIIINYAIWTTVAAFLLRVDASRSPVPVSLLCLVLAGPLNWSSTYPDSIIGVVQHTVAAIPVFVALHLRSGRPTGQRLRQRIPDTRVRPHAPAGRAALDG
jgi:hypothetical protein